MKSSQGNYWVALDHVRALAALLVFVWHFTHRGDGYPVPFEGAPAVFPLALLDEGHTGVAVFMTLSGYLFAKLLDGKDIVYSKFFWNRFIRLAPLLLVVMALVGIERVLLNQSVSADAYLQKLASGLILPEWPNGGWSVTAEIHFYIILPFILVMARRNANWIVVGLLASLLLRTLIYRETGTVQDAAYYTIIGRIDQFLLGIYLFLKRDWLAGRTGLVLASFAVFCGLVWLFDSAGGFFQFGGAYPSTTAWWIVIPTIEGAAYAVAIACYDRNFRPGNGWFSQRLAEYGKFSYSIYLLHFFVVFRAAHAINEWIVPLDNFYLAAAVGVAAFACMYPLGWLSFKFIEGPCLRYRTRYTVPRTTTQVSFQ